MFTIHPPELFGQQLFANTRVVVALVDWEQEGEGQIAVLLPRYELALKGLFHQALQIDTPGPFQGQTALPWTLRAMDHIVRDRLPRFGLIAYGYHY